MMESPQLICPSIGAARGLHAFGAESKPGQYERVLYHQGMMMFMENSELNNIIDHLPNFSFRTKR